MRIDTYASAAASFAIRTTLVQTIRVALMTSLVVICVSAAASSSALPSQLRVADEHGGHIVVACHTPNGGPGTWIEQQPGVASRDGFVFRVVDSKDMPGDEVYLACDDGRGDSGFVSTGDAPIPPQFIVKKSDEVDAGTFMVVDIESAPSADSFQSIFFVVKTYDGDALITTADATIVIEGNSGSAQVFRAPLETKIASTNAGFGVRRGAAPAGSATCQLTYFDPNFEKKTILANTSCANLGKVLGWGAVADQNLPAAYLSAASNAQKEPRR
jgi:hypothetical protein